MTNPPKRDTRISVPPPGFETRTRDELLTLVRELSETVRTERSRRERAEHAFRGHDQRLRLAARAARIGFWEYDVETGAIYHSTEWGEQLGLEPAQAAGGYALWKKLIHPDDLARVEREFERHVGPEMESFDIDYRMRHADGGYRWFEARGQVERDEDGAARVVRGCQVDITARKAADQRIREDAARLDARLMQTLGAITGLGAVRDAYTAGHERRVAFLAVAIGERLGLDAERLRGVKAGALVHDIGKVGIPSEILSKPARLSGPEFALVRTHAQIGFEILHQVDFPWPVAAIAHQHHERIDGTGYPQGLRGDAILVEARIVGVADVFEAMASHRPYRAAVGIDRALEELRAGRGSRYDADAVDACAAIVVGDSFDMPAQRYTLGA